MTPATNPDDGDGKVAEVHPPYEIDPRLRGYQVEPSDDWNRGWNAALEVVSKDRLFPALKAELAEARAEVEKMRKALLSAVQSMSCGKGGHAACYCPNCDSNFYGPREICRAALTKGA